MFVCSYFTRFCLTICFRVSLVECLLYLPLGLNIGRGRNASWFMLSLGILPYFPLECQFSIPLSRQKWCMAQVPEIACEPLFNGTWTDFSCVLFLMLVRAALYCKLTSEWKCLWGDGKFQFPFPLQKKRMWSLPTTLWYLPAPYPRGW